MAQWRLLLMLLLTPALAACGTNEGVVSQAAPAPSPTSSAAVPDAVKQALARGGTIVEDAYFDGGLSAKQALRRFHEDYGTGHDDRYGHLMSNADTDLADRMEARCTAPLNRRPRATSAASVLEVRAA